VLYCREENTWKLADFGISAEAASTMSTTAARGTGGYRAPELLREDPKFSSSVDLWALGCVLYEIAVGKRAFLNDYYTTEYSRSSEPPPLVDFGTEFYRYHVNEVLRKLFNRDSKQRPKAPSMCSIFQSYYCVFGLPTAGRLSCSTTHLSYPQWKEAVDEDPLMLQGLFFRLAFEQELAGDRAASISIFGAMNLRLQWSDMGKYSFPPERLQALNPTVIQELGRTLVDEDYRRSAILLYKAAIQAYPERFDFQRELLEQYIRGVPARSSDIDLTFKVAFEPGSVSNPRLIFRELSIVCLDAGTKLPTLSNYEEEISYPWSALATSHACALRMKSNDAVDLHREIRRSSKMNWTRLHSDLMDHFENQLPLGSQMPLEVVLER
jgi:hypothetical protein